MKYNNENDFGGFSSRNNNSDMSSDKGFNEPSKGGSVSDRTDSMSSQNNESKINQDSDFGSYSQSRSSDNLSGARNDNSKKLSEMSSAEKKQALAGDAVDYASGNYVGIADRHKEDIKDGAKKAAAVKATTEAAKTTAKAALITKGINAAKGFFQMLGGLAKAIGSKIAGAFVAAGNFIAGMLGISATVATFAVGGSAVLALVLAGTMVVNMVTMNMIQKTDDGCVPVAWEEQYNDGAAALAEDVCVQAETWATHEPHYQYLSNGEAWSINEPGGPTEYGHGTGIDCGHFAQVVFWKCGSDVITKDKRYGNCDAIAENLSEYKYEAKSEEDIKDGSIVLFLSGNEYKHAAIYVGDGQCAHAANSRSGVKMGSLSGIMSGFTSAEYYYPYKSRGSGYTRTLKTNSKSSQSFSVRYVKDTPENTTKEQIIVRCWGALKQCGCTDVAAAAIMGNIQGESGFVPNRQQTGGPAAGLFQMEASRQTGSRRFCRQKTGDEYNVEAQVEYAMKEANKQLKTYSGGNRWFDYNTWSQVGSKPSHEAWAWWGSEKYDLNKFNSKKDVRLLTEVFERCFERASIPHMDNRIKWAEAFLARADELNLASGNMSDAKLDEDDGCGDTYRNIASEGAQGAVEWARMIAEDDSFTYGTGETAHRGGCYFCGTNWGPNKYKKAPGYEKTYCCNPFVFAAYAHGGKVDSVLESCKRGGCGGMSPSNWTCHGFILIGATKDVPFEDLLLGDVVMVDNAGGSGHHHVWLVGDPDQNELIQAGGGNWGPGSIAVSNSLESTYNKYRTYNLAYVVRYTGQSSD